jgi:gentisate 1,2-dioxygenase
VAEKNRTEKLAATNYWDEFFRLRDEEREKNKDAVVIVKGQELPWEINKQGVMRWYLHPSIQDTVIKPFIFYTQKIPPGSRSGKLTFQGGQVVYAWKGRGHTILDEMRYDWQAGDIIQFPLRIAGVTYQHFNDDENQAAELICVEADTVGALGVDKGSGFEQREFSPEYETEKRGKA